MTLLLPEIADHVGASLLEATEGMTASEATGLVDFAHPMQAFPAISGERVEPEQLQELREALLDVAAKHGFPDTSMSKTAGFDRECAEVLHSRLPITPNTAASRGAWTFLSCVVLVDIALWRFPSRNIERFVGNPNRNAFRRLWMRYEILGPPERSGDPVWDREDVLVQIMERPGVAENRNLARDICLVYREHWHDRPGPVREHLVRNFMLRIMRRQGLTRMECVDRDRRLEMLNAAAEETTRALARSGDVPTEGPAAGRPTTDEGELPSARVVTSPAPRDSAGVTQAQTESDAYEPVRDIEDVPINELVRKVQDCVDGMKLGFSPAELDSSLIRSGIRVGKRHRKTVELVFKELRDEDHLVKTNDNRWTASGQVLFGSKPEIQETMSDLQRMAGTMGLEVSDDREKLIRKLGIEQALPKYLKRMMNSAIGSVAKAK